MKTMILLKDHNVYSWEKKNNLMSRIGFLSIPIDERLTENRISLDYVRRLNGNFVFIREDADYITIIGDKYQSFPVLYLICDDKIIISDSLKLIEDIVPLQLKERSLYEFLAMGVVTGSETLFNNLHIVEAGQIVMIEKETGKIIRKDYYMHRHLNDYKKSFEELKVELDARLFSVFNRVKKQLGDRTVVVPLSGGYDSRLVVEMLKKVEVKNVICVSYGRTQNLEVKVAERLAGELGFKWLYIQQSGELVEEMVADQNFWPVMREISCASAIPYVQNYIIKLLCDEGKIPPNSVIMTGNSGDVVEGDQMPDAFADTNANYSRRQLLNQIINKHYRLAGQKGGSIPGVHKKITDNYLKKASYSYDEVHDIYETFNWRERQSQFLFNDGQFYSEYCGVEWFFPLWDDEFVEFWLHLPTKIRYKRDFYYKYVNKEQIYSANDMTFRAKLLAFAKNYFYWILIKMYKNKRMKEYDNGDTLWHLLGREDFISMVKWTKGVGTSSDTAKIWGLLINCFDMNPGDIDFSIYGNFKIM